MDHRKSQERGHLRAVRDSADPIHSLITVELSIAELCNRKCVFCPRVDPSIYPNLNLHMSGKVAEKVATDVAAVNSNARMSFSGFGEPILHKDFPGIIRTIRSHLPNNMIEVNTNGDKLTPQRICELFEAGLT